MQDAIIKIYNASAGSGKTFALTKEYLSKIISSGNPGYFRHILAITFTNKAVNEMKNRIVQNLFAFTDESILEQDNEMFQIICKESGLSPLEVKQRAKNAVDFLLNNYSYFDVETIDKFNHRLIRTFARDLKLSSNFKVELNVDSLVNEAVDRLIAKVGKEKQLTKVVIDYMIEKTSEDKSWDIAIDLYDIAKLLISENQIPHIQKLAGKTIDDFLALKKFLFGKRTQNENEIRETAAKFFEIVRENSLGVEHFSGKYVYTHFLKLHKGDFSVRINGAKWQEFNPPIYPVSKTSPSDALTVDRLTPEFKALFDTTIELIRELNLFNLLLKNINSLTLLNSIREEFEAIQNEKNILPISEFNRIINNEIKNQPVPFIYERLGEKYRHFLIDEFQDTSEMQWKNLVPLIDNSLSQADEGASSGSLFLVGDAKQSVYRWRGGFPEQFMNLCDKKTDFSVQDITVRQLETNYRSCEQIIDFNNRFFSFTSKFFLDENHQKLYLEGNAQKFNKKEGGFVSIEFIEGANKDEKNQNYPPAVLCTIKEVLGHGYNPEDIVILVRKNEMGVEIASFLADNGIQVSSSEALIIEGSPQVRAVLDVLRLVANFGNQKAKADLLGYLYEHVRSDEERHLFIKENLNTTQTQFESFLETLNIYFTFHNALSAPLYELCEDIVQKFIFEDFSTAHLQSFLEKVLEFTSGNRGIVNDFLEYWQNLKSPGVDNSGASQGVKIMSVHKSKGLEFPVVIYPYAEDEFKFHRNTTWLPLDSEKFLGFDEMLVDIKKSLTEMGETEESLYLENLKKLQLDIMNVVYVAQTRATDQLYILTNLNKSKSTASVAGFYKYFLEQNQHWRDTQTRYTFGNPEKGSASEKKSVNFGGEKNRFRKSSHRPHLVMATQNAYFWNTSRGDAIEKGNLLHLILSYIHHKESIVPVLNRMEYEGKIEQTQKEILQKEIEQIVNHILLKDYFESTAEVTTEQEIFLSNGEVIRPDRINFLPNHQVTIIDYKTGGSKDIDRIQLAGYAEALEKLGFAVKEKILVYITGQISVERV